MLSHSEPLLVSNDPLFHRTRSTTPPLLATAGHANPQGQRGRQAAGATTSPGPSLASCRGPSCKVPSDSRSRARAPPSIAGSEEDHQLAKPTDAGTPMPRQHHDHNELQLPYLTSGHRRSRCARANLAIRDLPPKACCQPGGHPPAAGTPAALHPGQSPTGCAPLAANESPAEDQHLPSRLAARFA